MFCTGPAIAAPHAVSAAPAPGLADCNADTHARVLVPAPTAALPATAHWLDGTRLQWPQRDATGRFRLYHSRDGRIVASPGQRVLGADGALALRRASAPLPSSLASRFAFVAPGVVLEIAPADRTQLAALHAGQLVLVEEDATGRTLAATRVQAAGALDALFAPSAQAVHLGPSFHGQQVKLALWAPTAQQVQLCLYPGATTPASQMQVLQRDATSGTWSATLPLDPQVQREISVREGEAEWLLSDPRMSRAIRDAEQQLAAGGGRLVVRASGTEPLLRVMGEGPDETLVTSVVDAILAAGSALLAERR